MSGLNAELQNYFGFSEFKAGQRQVVETILNGESALAVFPTGGGKSLCFQLPAVLLPGLTVVISPLLALMKDQVDFLKKKGVAAARIDSTLSADEVTQTVSDVMQNRLKIVYLSPERVASQRWQDILKKCRIDLLVIDEIHCVSEWGHNFRPDYLKLAGFVKTLNCGRVLGLTATATPKVIEDVAAAFSVKSEFCFVNSFFRGELTFNFRVFDYDSDKQQFLLKQLSSRPSGATIVYVTLQKTAEAVAQFLSENGIEAVFYHAGMNSERREAVQQQFMMSDRLVIVATIAFGMGVDKQDIRYVYHYNIPKSIENYVQETGRAARDGKPAVCDLLAVPDDLTTLHNFVYGDTPELDTVKRLIDFVCTLPDRFDVSFYELAVEFDIRPLVLSTFFTYLELDGVIASDTPFYSSTKVEFLEKKEAVIGRFSGPRAQFLSDLFESGKMGRKWLTLSINGAAEQLNEPVSRIDSALNYLADQGWITTQVAGLRQRYHFVNRPAEAGALTMLIFDRFLVREERETAQVDRLIGLLNHQGCKVNYVLDYFGERRTEACDRCSFCVEQGQRPFVFDSVIVLGEKEKEVVKRTVDLAGEVLQSPRAVARFLCGISSPATSRFKIEYTKPDGTKAKAALTKSRNFGIFAKVPFVDVLAFVDRVGRG